MRIILVQFRLAAPPGQCLPGIAVIAIVLEYAVNFSGICGKRLKKQKKKKKKNCSGIRNPYSLPRFVLCFF